MPINKAILNIAFTYARKFGFSYENSQDIALEFAEKMLALKDVTKTKAFIRTASRNHIISELRRRKSQNAHELHLDDPQRLAIVDKNVEHDPQLHLETVEFWDRMLDAVTLLRGNQNICFVRHFLHDESIKSIALDISLSEGAVEQLLHRAKKNMEKRLRGDNLKILSTYP